MCGRLPIGVLSGITQRMGETRKSQGLFSSYTPMIKDKLSASGRVSFQTLESPLKIHASFLLAVLGCAIIQIT